MNVVVNDPYRTDDDGFIYNYLSEGRLSALAWALSRSTNE